MKKEVRRSQSDSVAAQFVTMRLLVYVSAALLLTSSSKTAAQESSGNANDDEDNVCLVTEVIKRLSSSRSLSSSALFVAEAERPRKTMRLPVSPQKLARARD